MELELMPSPQAGEKGNTLPKVQRVYFQSDEPLSDLSREDAFGHAHYAEALYEILENTEDDKSYAIGLFGKWGVGKTSIALELGRLISERAKVGPRPRHAYKFEVVDCWAFASQSFRREFLQELATRFGCVGDIKERLSTSHTVESKETPRHDARWWKQLLGQVALVLVAALVVVVAGTRLAGLSPGWATALAVFVTLALGAMGVFTDNIKELFRFRTTLVETQPVVYADEFRTLFREIILPRAREKRSDGRTVLVLDNLDRVPEDVVLDVLGAVKTFLNENRLVYIIPCDDDGLKQHIMRDRDARTAPRPMTEADANEYLRKYFRVSVRMREFLDDDLERFVAKTVSQMAVFDRPEILMAARANGITEAKSAVRLVLRVAGQRNPRRVKQFANRITADCVLAIARAKAHPPLRETVLANIGFLAKMAVIEEEWPEFARSIRSHPRLLNEVDAYLISENVGRASGALRQVIDKNEWNAGLCDFLIRTYAIRTPRPEDFICMKARSAVGGVKAGAELLDLAVSGDTRAVSVVFAEEGADTSAQVGLLIEELRRHARAADVHAVWAMIRSLVSALPPLEVKSEVLLEEAANAVATEAQKSVYFAWLLGPELPLLLDLLAYCSIPSFREKIVNAIILQQKDLSVPARQEAILRKLMDGHAILTQKNRNTLREVLSTASADDKVWLMRRALAEYALAKNEGLARDVIPQEVYRHVVSHLKGEPNEAKPAIEFLKRFAGYVDDATKDAFSTVVLGFMDQPNTGMTHLKKRALDFTLAMPPEAHAGDKRPQLMKALSAFAEAQLTAGNETTGIAAMYAHLLPVMSASEQGVFSGVLHRLLSKCADSELVGVMKVLGTKKNDVHNPDALMQHLAPIVAGKFAKTDLRRGYIDLCSALGRPKSATELIRQRAAGNLDAYEALTEVRPVLEDTDFHTLVLDLMKACAGLPGSTAEKALGVLAGHVKSLTRDFMAAATDVLLNQLLTSAHVETRRGALAFWRSAKGIGTEQSRRFHDGLLTQVKLAIAGGTISQEKDKLILDALMDFIGDVEQAQQTEVVRVALSLTEDGREQRDQQLGHAELQRLVGVDAARKQVPASLLPKLEVNQQEDFRRQTLNTLSKYWNDMDAADKERLRTYLESHKGDRVVEDFVDRFK